MTKAKRHGVLSIRSTGAKNTPGSKTRNAPTSSAADSAYPTPYASDDDSIAKPPKGTVTSKSFRFLELPSELRSKIYGLVFSTVPSILDLDPSIFSLLNRTKALALFSVNHQIHDETVHNFFSTHTIRLFPTYPGRYFKAKKPLLARLPQRYRSSITSLQLRLGPGWNNPPRGWVVNDALGLADCANVRVLKVFVECDPSDAIFQGFRAGDGFYERFSASLLDDVLQGISSIKVVEFDAYSSVQRSGDMMSGLREVVARHDKVIGWGQERGWKDEVDQVWLDTVLIHGLSGRKVARSVAVLA